MSDHRDHSIDIFDLTGPGGSGAPLFIPHRLHSGPDALFDLAVKEAAERMGVPVETVLDLVADGPAPGGGSCGPS
ncbi:hypothetical protein ACIA8H_12820 [Streptomyces goshikiensis]|uniref:hypothetical protein n=1 Tax=Streptomyces goshikiensis TaxID=1942 RepID=UPI0037A53B30